MRSQSETTTPPTSRIGYITFGSMNVGAVVKISVSRKTTNSAKIRLKMKNERLSDCRSRSVWNAKRSIPIDRPTTGTSVITTAAATGTPIQETSTYMQ